MKQLTKDEVRALVKLIEAARKTAEILDQSVWAPNIRRLANPLMEAANHVDQLLWR